MAITYGGFGKKLIFEVTEFTKATPLSAGSLDSLEEPLPDGYTYPHDTPYQTPAHKRVLVPEKNTGQCNASWTYYDNYRGAKKSHFIGAEPGKRSFTIKLMAQNGIHPQNMLDLIKDYVERGTVQLLTIGSKKHGLHFIQSARDSNHRYSGGLLTVVHVALEMGQYNG